MKKEKLFIWIFIIGLIILVIAAVSYQNYIAGQKEQEEQKKEESETFEPTPIPENSMESVVHCLENRTIGTGMITIDSPAVLDGVSNPFEVKGTANVFEGSFIIKLKLCDGRTIVDTLGQSSGEIGENNPYSTTISYSSQYAGLEAYIEAYNLSPKDGTVENLIQVPIRLK